MNQITNTQPSRFKGFVMPDRLTGNREIAIALCKAGVRVFPCRGGTGPDAKNPCPGIMWQSVPLGDMGRIEQWWSRWPDAMPAINTVDLGILFVDLDGDKGNLQWAEECAANGYTHTGPRTRTPGGGWHLAFRVPEGVEIGNSIGGFLSKKQGGMIDIRAPGRGYVVAAGAENGGGGLYEPEGGDNLAFLDCPEMPAWLVALLLEKVPRDERGLASPATGLQATNPPWPQSAHADTNPARLPATHQAPLAATNAPTNQHTNARIEKWAEAAYEKEIDTVTNHGEGGRNMALNAAAFSLGQIVAGGYLNASRVREGLRAAAHACGLMKDDGRKAVEATISSGMRGGKEKPRQPPADILEDDADEAAGRAAAEPAMRARNGQAVNPETGALIEEEEEDEEFDDASILDTNAQAELPLELSNPPGLVGRLTRWIADGTDEPIPVLALMAALSIVGVVTGRYWCGPTRTTQGLFVIGLAPSGTGKDHYLKSVQRILHAAGCGQMVAAGDAHSYSAFIRLILRKPVVVVPADEVAALLKKILSKRASSHEAGISKFLREIFTIHTDPYTTPSTAQGGDEEISAPQLTLFGVSVPSEFFEAIGGGEKSNGLLGRMLYAGTDAIPPTGLATVNPHDVPSDITDKLRALWGGNNEGSRAIAADPGAKIDHRMVSWESEEAEQEWRAFKLMQRDFCRANPDDGLLFARTAEHAIRLATIVALGENSLKPSVSVENVRWGCAVATWSAQSMVRVVNLNMANTDTQRDTKIVLRKILELKKKKVRRASVTRSLKGHFSSRLLLELYKTLEDAGEITLTKENGKTKPIEWIYLGRRK